MGRCFTLAKKAKRLIRKYHPIFAFKNYFRLWFILERMKKWKNIFWSYLFVFTVWQEKLLRRWLHDNGQGGEYWTAPQNLSGIVRLENYFIFFYVLLCFGWISANQVFSVRHCSLSFLIQILPNHEKNSKVPSTFLSRNDRNNILLKWS